jgi:transcriptional regulator with XRE-family HTH domain
VSRGFSPTNEALGAALRRLRIERGLTQKRVSAGSGLNTSYLSDIERGERNPTWASLGRICAALGVRVSEAARLAEELDDDHGGQAAGPPR